MTDREMLIESLKKGVNLAKDKVRGEGEAFSWGDVADYILADGWIRPPCKVGDTVYYIAGKKVYKSKCHAITQHKNGLQIHLYDYDGDNARYSTKDVFLTKDEAEEKLKELQNNA